MRAFTVCLIVVVVVLWNIPAGFCRPLLGLQKGEECEQMYGFLPCSKNVAGHLFLILVYEFLLFNGESYVASGGGRIFKILGPGVFGASAFELIGSLPEAFILLASGLISDEEGAQECVITGVGLLAGSTTLLLTLVWGTCIILSSQPFNTSTPNPNVKLPKNPLENLFLVIWPGYGATTDFGTSYTARIMLLSAVPLAMMQILTIFDLPALGEKLVVLITLIVSIIFLISYFFYQLFNPWIQRRRLLYIKHEHLVVDVLKHLQKNAAGSLLNNDGAPNISTMKKLFLQRDHDGDKFLSFNEIRNCLKEINFRNEELDKDDAAAKIMSDFDMDSDQKITMDEFVSGMMKWLDHTKSAMSDRSLRSANSLKHIYQVLKPWMQKKKEERDMMRHLIPEVLENLRNNASDALLTPDGTPNVDAIKRLFRDIDLDDDNCLTYLELKELVTNMEWGVVPYDADVVASKIMEELDVSGDQLVNEDEFVGGLTKWLTTSYNPTFHHDLSKKDDEVDKYEKTWEQTEKIMDDKLIDKSPLAWIKALSLLTLGIVMLGLLAEPLIHSVREFSKAANLPTFYVSFVFVPLATTARLAVSAIREARERKVHTTSLTLSEIYGTVFMNNVLGLIVLLSLIYFRGLTWDFSTEVLMVLIVSLIIGCLAGFSTVFPVWTSVLAYMLYPLSLVSVYAMARFNWLSSDVFNLMTFVS